MQGLVYINYGRVIVDCPYGCGNAYRVKPGQKDQKCYASDGCHVSFPLDVPDNFDDIVKELKRRPKTDNQHWMPEGHPIAVRSRGKYPMGQSVSDLRAEYEMMSKKEK